MIYPVTKRAVNLILSGGEPRKHRSFWCGAHPQIEERIKALQEM